MLDPTSNKKLERDESEREANRQIIQRGLDRLRKKIGEESWQRLQEAGKKQGEALAEYVEQWTLDTNLKLESWDLPKVTSLESLEDLARLTGRKPDTMTAGEVVDWALERQKEVSIREEIIRRASERTQASELKNGLDRETCSFRWNNDLFANLSDEVMDAMALVEKNHANGRVTTKHQLLTNTSQESIGKLFRSGDAKRIGEMLLDVGKSVNLPPLRCPEIAR